MKEKIFRVMLVPGMDEMGDVRYLMTRDVVFLEGRLRSAVRIAGT
jgi:hypothetical protein